MLNQQNHNKEYTLADIEKYLQGQMSSTEMYTLEKAALQDSFLADAIEGYTNTSVHKAKQHLQFIQQKLFAVKQEREKSITTSFWFRAAASVVSFACLYTISGLIFDQEKSLSKTTVIEQQILPPKTAINTERSNISYKNKVHDEPAKKENKNSPVSIPEENNTRLKIANGDRDFFKDDKAKTSEETQPSVISGLDKEENKDQIQQKQFANQAPPKELEKSATNDYDRNENRRYTETLRSKVKNIAIGPRANQSQQNTYGSIANQQEIIKAKQEKKVSADIVVAKPNTEAYPEGGWQVFDLYVHNTLQNEGKNKDGRELGKTVRIEKQVEVEFSIDAQGKPYDIQIVQSSGNKSYDDNIILIVEKGPKWITVDQTKRTRAKIKL